MKATELREKSIFWEHFNHVYPNDLAMKSIPLMQVKIKS